MPKIDQRLDLLMYAKMAQRGLGYVAGQLELTSDCSQRCAFCDSWRKHRTGKIAGTIPLWKVHRLFEELTSISTFEHLSFTGGDPQDWKDPENPEIGFDTLLENLEFPRRFSLQVNTALIQSLDVDLWRERLDRIRVSLDAVTRETYRKARGDDRDPLEVLERIESLDHPGLAINTCVSPLNIGEVPQIIRTLNSLRRPPRKAMFLAVIGPEKNPEFWREYAQLKNVPSPRVQTSFQEDVEETRVFTEAEACRGIPCRAGSIGFHIKCNGDVYPCCLVGGEAIETENKFVLGNVFEESLSAIQKRYTAPLHYKNETCRKVCQWKQLQINYLAEEASKTTLTMP